MAQYPELRGQLTIGASNNGINVGVNALTLTSGTYYTVAAGNESNGLTDQVQTQIRTIAGQGNVNVSYSTSTGRISIALNTAQTLNMESGLAHALGFSATDYANAATHTADRCPQHIWRPTRPMGDHPVDANVFWSPRSSTIVGRSVDGTTYSRAGTTVYDAEFTIGLLPAADVVTPSGGTIYRDLQQFYEAVVCQGMPIRIYPDRTATANSDHWREGLWGVEEQEDGVGSFNDYCDRHVKRWQSLWNVTIPMIKKV